MNDKLAEQYRNEYRELYQAAHAFVLRFDSWIMAQDEPVKFSTALAFGEEYQQLREWFEVPEATNAHQ